MSTVVGALLLIQMTKENEDKGKVCSHISDKVMPLLPHQRHTARRAKVGSGLHGGLNTGQGCIRSVLIGGGESDQALMFPMYEQAQTSHEQSG